MAGRPSATAPMWRGRVLVASATLAALGILLALLRAALLPPSLPGDERAWSVTIGIVFDASQPNAELHVQPPWDQPNARVIAERIAHSGLQVPRIRTAGGGRALRALARESGQQWLQARYDLRVDPGARPSRNPGRRLGATERQRLTAAGEWLPVTDPQIVAAGNRWTGLGAEALAAAIHTRVAGLGSAADGPHDTLATLAGGRGSDLGRTRLAVTLARAGGLPARVVTGVRLTAIGHTQPSHWAEVYFDDRWHPLDPKTPVLGTTRPPGVAFMRGGESFVTLEHGRLQSVDVRLDRVALPQALRRNPVGWFEVLELERLPPATLQAAQLLLLMPLCVLITVFMRGVVGVRTYGTFTPTLLALAALAVDWITATVVFVLVGLFGSTGRVLLPRLRLSRTPRLGTVFTLVALGMAVAVSLLHEWSLASEGTALLLPVIILTTLVDRVYAVADEDGMAAALVRLAWTGVTTAACVPVFLFPGPSSWFARFPELHLATIAAIFLAGAYRGRTLADVTGWQTLREPRARGAAERRAAPRTD